MATTVYFQIVIKNMAEYKDLHCHLKKSLVFTTHVQLIRKLKRKNKYFNMKIIVKIPTQKKESTYSKGYRS